MCRLGERLRESVGFFAASHKHSLVYGESIDGSGDIEMS
jgi:hypothetical protein